MIRKVGDDYILYSITKGVNGKRTRLGTHPTREKAVKQEQAIKSSQVRIKKQ